MRNILNEFIQSLISNSRDWGFLGCDVTKTCEGEEFYVRVELPYKKSPDIIDKLELASIQIKLDTDLTFRVISYEVFPGVTSSRNEKLDLDEFLALYNSKLSSKRAQIILQNL